MRSKQTKSILAKPVQHDEAFITSVIRYGEADCIVRLLGKHKGAFCAYYKGGFSGKKGLYAVGAPALATIGFIPQMHKMPRLIFCDMDPLCVTGHRSLKVFGYICYIAELIEKFLPEEDPQPEIFSLVKDSWLVLQKEGAQPGLLRAFELRLLDACGFLPEIPKSPERNLIKAFDPLACRFVTDAVEHSVTFTAQALLIAESMLIAKVGSVNYDKADELLMIGRIFQSRLKLMGIGPLKSVMFLKQISVR